VSCRTGRVRRQWECHLYFARRVSFLSCADRRESKYLSWCSQLSWDQIRLRVRHAASISMLQTDTQFGREARYDVALEKSSPKNRGWRFPHITFEASSCVAALAAILRGSLKWSSLFPSHSQYEYDCEENFDDAYDGKQPTVLRLDSSNPQIGACGAHTSCVPYLVPLLVNARVSLE
jgi:hypothetical protein